ncbi:tyrosine-type recombinase/integrase [uncultured Lamprocystis sp.]|jgi:integrase|uniref:tyrosine-type recombinase/integrase n=1 Tax=uncultured Lamprocystis sp. TaxID=543132 RepID=UPI0025CC1620|nr:tyrosine-type recombinase/integrase [uncultured Lamprocystis sp.]
MRDKQCRGLTLRGGFWWINIDRRIGGRQVQIRESTGCGETDLAGARAVRDRRVKEETDRPVAPANTDQHGPERTFSDAAAEYVLDLERRGKDSGRALQDIRMILDEAGDWPLSHLHQRAIQPRIDAQQGHRASGTVDRALRTLSTVLHFAAEVLRDGNEPWLQTAPRLRSPDWGARARRPITWDEQDRLIAELPAHLIGPVLWAVHTGARQEEVCSLTWAQHRPVDGLPEWSCWWIPPEVRKASSKAKVSDRDGRYIVCNRAARSVIADQVGASAIWVFLSPRGGRLYRVTNNGFRAARERAGLKDMREHDLRHTFGDRAADVGIPQDIVAVLLGHRRQGITAHYSRPGLARLTEETERIVRPAGRLAAVG